MWQSRWLLLCAQFWPGRLGCARKNKRLNKNITICLLENIFEKLNLEQLKEVLINLLKKYFSNNDKDIFGLAEVGIKAYSLK